MSKGKKSRNHMHPFSFCQDANALPARPVIAIKLYLCKEAEPIKDYRIFHTQLLRFLKPCSEGLARKMCCRY